MVQRAVYFRLYGDGLDQRGADCYGPYFLFAARDYGFHRPSHRFDQYQSFARAVGTALCALAFMAACLPCPGSVVESHLGGRAGLHPGVGAQTRCLPAHPQSAHGLGLDTGTASFQLGDDARSHLYPGRAGRVHTLTHLPDLGPAGAVLVASHNLPFGAGAELTRPDEHPQAACGPSGPRQYLRQCCQRGQAGHAGRSGSSEPDYLRVRGFTVAGLGPLTIMVRLLQSATTHCPTGATAAATLTHACATAYGATDCSSANGHCN